MAVWFPMIRSGADRIVQAGTPAVAALVAPAMFLPYSPQIVALLMIGLVTLTTVRTNGALDRADGLGH